MKKKLNIYITDKCNKQCPWCYVDKKANKTMDIKTANRIIDFKEDGKYIDKMTTYEEFLRLYK